MVADNMSSEDIVAACHKRRGDVVGITATTYQTKYTKMVSKAIKQSNDKILIVLGGPHLAATYADDGLDAFPYIDVGVYGEGERSFVDIIEGKTLKDIKGIIYRQSGGVITTEKGDFVDLDSLPFANPKLVNLKAFSGPNPIGRNKIMQIMASRGCPFNCTFCCKPIYGRNVRFHSAEYVIEEACFLHKDFGIEEICLQDDTFNLNQDWMISILEGIIKRGLHKKVILRIGLRADQQLIREDVLRLAKRSGVWLAFIGVESGNQYMLDRMNKNISLREIERAFKLCQQVGIKGEAPFILGLPGETHASVAQNLRFWKSLKSYSSWFSKAMPFPGTAFRREVIKKGHIIAGDYDDYSPDTSRVRTDELSVADLDEWYKYCNKIMLRDLMWQATKDPLLVYRTIKGFGPKEIITKMLRNV